MNELKNKIVTILGGSGFVGKQIAKRLIDEGAIVKIAARFPDRAIELMTRGHVGQVSFIECNVLKESSIRNALRNSDIVINSIGILAESGKQTFSNVHVKSAKIIARTIKDLGISQLINISALGVNLSSDTSQYSKSKFDAENAMLAVCPQMVIVRPSVVFGESDSFTMKFKRMFKMMPFFPLFGGGHSKFQPVHVEDVAKGVLKIICHFDQFEGKVFEFAGSDILSFKEMMNLIKEAAETKIMFIPMPFFLSKIMGFFMGLLSNAPVTMDQIELLKYDNVIMKNSESLNFSNLGIKPQSFRELLRTYL